MQHLNSSQDTSPDIALLQDRIERLLNFEGPRYRRLWGYYRNPMLPVTMDVDSQGSERPYRQAQEWGLPPRITGVVVRASSSSPHESQPVEGVARKEVVVENDIAWRIETMVDYLFGKPIVINSTATDPERRERIEKLARAIIAHNGGITFLQQLALMGAVYGFVDVLVKFDAGACGEEPSPQPAPGVPGEGVGGKCAPGLQGEGVRARGAAVSDKSESPTSGGSGPSVGSGCPVGSLLPQAESAPVTPCDESTAPAACSSSSSDDSSSRASGASDFSRDDALERIARMVRLEIVEPARALPLLCPTDWRVVDAYVQVYQIPHENSGKSAPLRVAAKRGLLHKLLSRFAATRRGALFGRAADESDHITITEILTAHHWQRYEDDKLTAHGRNSLGVIPLVHIQNTAVPFEYSGISDVEPLVPLQDELNTRLSDRAHRITLQSFKMYLGKGIENFINMPVAPGRMWMTDNEQAEVIEFGGDASAPSEDRHIFELREALDKTSGVSPIAAGAIKGRIGRLTSAAALRVTLLALLAKTERKRTTYGEGIERMIDLSLAWLDRAGIFLTRPDERRVEIHWPNPIPLNEIERLEEAKLKRELGIPEETVLRELGY